MVDISTIKNLYYIYGMKKLEGLIFYNLEKAIKSYRKFAQLQLKEKGLTITIDQWLVLKTISENTEIDQTKIADTIFKDKASVTRIVELLVRKKLMTKQKDKANRRKHQLILTQGGKTLIGQVLPIIKNNRTVALKNISQKNTAAVQKVLKTIIANCTK